MHTRECTFFSDGIRLDGLLQFPEQVPHGGMPVMVLCSGYQGLKEIMPAKFWGPFTDAGYACFAFDYRGFGTSEGERGRLLPEELAEDVQNAITFLEQQPELDPARVGLLGWGFGGGIVVHAAAQDARSHAVACVNGIGDASRAVRDTRTYADWLVMQDRIAEDRRQRVVTGRSARVGPWDIVPLDPDTRTIVDDDMYGKHERFGIEMSLQSAEAYYAFRPERVVDRISPRPLLIVHGVRNTLHPIDEARSLYAHAREPKEIVEIPRGQHLDWIQFDSPAREPVMSRIVGWFLQHLPVDRTPSAGGPRSALEDDQPIGARRHPS